MRLLQVSRYPNANVLDRVVDELFRGFAAPNLETRPHRLYTPRVELGSTEDQLLVSVELAGFDEADVDLSIHEDHLIVKGERKKDERFPNAPFGAFERVITLPVEIDRDKVKATFKNGVLAINLPKAQVAKPETRKIAINA